jgi:1-deoxy-D-xylulose-5-phosphate reductoisomerase
MGGKITIDSATLMNKGFEVIEAHHLFGLPYEKIKVLVHPQSLIHSMVEFKDGALKAQIGEPTMKVPIQLALTYPERLENKRLPGMKLERLNEMTFEAPDLDKFPCLKYAYEAGRAGGTLPAVLNAANEAAVEQFLAGRIGYPDIAKIIRKAMNEHKIIRNPGLEEILAVDQEVKERIRSNF